MIWLGGRQVKILGGLIFITTTSEVTMAAPVARSWTGAWSSTSTETRRRCSGGGRSPDTGARTHSAAAARPSRSSLRTRATTTSTRWTWGTTWCGPGCATTARSSSTLGVSWRLATLLVLGSDMIPLTLYLCVVFQMDLLPQEIDGGSYTSAAWPLAAVWPTFWFVQPMQQSDLIWN